MADVRDPIQEDILEMYLMANPMKATLELSTGIGKSKIASMIMNRVVSSHIYVIVESAKGRDTTWAKELKKHGQGSLLENYVTITTYQKLSRGKTEVRNDESVLVLMDEVDFMAGTPVYSSVLDLFSESRVIGLTGFITDDKREWFKENLPVLMTMTQLEAQNRGILNKIKFVFVKYDLSTDPNDMTVEYKTGKGDLKSFTQSENSGYQYEERNIQKLMMESSMAEADFRKGIINYDQYQKRSAKADYKLKYAINRRQELLFNSKSTAEMARRLLKYISDNNPDSKTIVFSKRTAQVDAIVGEHRAYHGKIPKVLAEQQFEQFNNGEIKVLGTCQKVQRGINVNNLNFGVLETFIGSDTLAVQKLGRLMRLKPDQEATCFVLLPYYMREQEDKTYVSAPTKQVDWASKMLRSTSVVDSAVWDYRVIKNE